MENSFEMQCVNKNKNKKLNKKSKKQENKETTEIEYNSPEHNTINMLNNPTNKRLRDVLQNSINESVAKAPRLTNIESPFKLMNSMDKRFDKLTEDLTEKLQTIIQTMFRECEERLLSEIDKRFNITKSDLDAVTVRVTSLESAVQEIKNTAMDEIIELRNETEFLKNEIVYLKSCARKQDNSIVAYDIRITNVPTEQNENLYDLYFRLCEAVNISPPNVKTIYRVKINRNNRNNYNNKNNQNNSKTRDAAIIVKFKCPYDRNFVLKTITSFIKTNKAPLQLNVIGFKSSVPFFVNENLTPENHRIFLKAYGLKKQGIISSVFTNRGHVFIKQLNEEDPIYIYEIDQLNQLFRMQSSDDENLQGCINTVLQNNREYL